MVSSSLRWSRAGPQSGDMRREGGFQVGSATQLRMEWPVRFVRGVWGRGVRLWGRELGSVRAVVVVGRRSVKARRW